jgi:hypothetical protein
MLGRNQECRVGVTQPAGGAPKAPCLCIASSNKLHSAFYKDSGQTDRDPTNRDLPKLVESLMYKVGTLRLPVKPRNLRGHIHASSNTVLSASALYSVSTGLLTLLLFQPVNAGGTMCVFVYVTSFITEPSGRMSYRHSVNTKALVCRSA